MNREIKFRAWDKENKDWEEYFHIMGDGTFLRDDTVDEGCYYLEEDKKRIVLVQYIGLKDKNGKEIYEGDILKINETAPSLPDPELVNFDFVGVVNYDDEGADFQISSKDNEIIRGFTNGQIREVIGNIYENPELIK